MEQPSQLAEYTLVPANADQALEARKRQITTWGRGMTDKQFLNREHQLEKLEHASDGKLTCWVLVPRDDLQTLKFKCACETYRRRALVAAPSSPPQEVIGYGIASVFCPLENRNKGYASHMMRLLHYVLSPSDSLPPFSQEWGLPPPLHLGVGRDARLSVLYSDVGDFYKRCGPSPQVSGWHIRSPVSTTWQLKPEELSDRISNTGPIHLLSGEECKSLWESDAAYIKDSLSMLPAAPHTRFTFLPNDGVAAFLMHRAQIETPLHPEYPRPLEHWGVSIPQTDPPTYATWTLDMKLSVPPVLVVTRLRASVKSFPALVEGLLWAARRIGANTLEVWNLDKELVDIAKNLGGVTSVRGEHLPAVAWYGPEHPNDVEWLFNEKFPWC